MDNTKTRKRIVYFCLEGKTAISDYTADGLVVCGDGFGDPKHSGLGALMTTSDGLSYTGGETSPFKHAIYVCKDFAETWKSVAALCEKGCRSVIVCIGGVVPPPFGDIVLKGLVEHCDCGWKVLCS